MTFVKMQVNTFSSSKCLFNKLFLCVSENLPPTITKTGVCWGQMVTRWLEYTNVHIPKNKPLPHLVWGTLMYLRQSYPKYRPIKGNQYSQL